MACFETLLCVCVCVRERERERERALSLEYVFGKWVGGEGRLYSPSNMVCPRERYIIFA